jgi:hypothetical protein
MNSAYFIISAPASKTRSEEYRSQVLQILKRYFKDLEIREEEGKLQVSGVMSVLAVPFMHREIQSPGATISYHSK